MFRSNQTCVGPIWVLLLVLIVVVAGALSSVPAQEQHDLEDEATQNDDDDSGFVDSDHSNEEVEHGAAQPTSAASSSSSCFSRTSKGRFSCFVALAKSPIFAIKSAVRAKPRRKRRAAAEDEESAVAGELILEPHFADQFSVILGPRTFESVNAISVFQENTARSSFRIRFAVKRIFNSSSVDEKKHNSKNRKSAKPIPLLARDLQRKDLAAAPSTTTTTTTATTKEQRRRSGISNNNKQNVVVEETDCSIFRTNRTATQPRDFVVLHCDAFPQQQQQRQQQQRNSLDETRASNVFAWVLIFENGEVDQEQRPEDPLLVIPVLPMSSDDEMTLHNVLSHPQSSSSESEPFSFVRDFLPGLAIGSTAPLITTTNKFPLCRFPLQLLRTTNPLSVLHIMSSRRWPSAVPSTVALKRRARSAANNESSNNANTRQPEDRDSVMLLRGFSSARPMLLHVAFVSAMSGERSSPSMQQQQHQQQEAVNISWASAFNVSKVELVYAGCCAVEDDDEDDASGQQQFQQNIVSQTHNDRVTLPLFGGYWKLQVTLSALASRRRRSSSNDDAFVVTAAVLQVAGFCPTRSQDKNFVRVSNPDLLWEGHGKQFAAFAAIPVELRSLSIASTQTVFRRQVSFTSRTSTAATKKSATGNDAEDEEETDTSFCVTVGWSLSPLGDQSRANDSSSDDENSRLPPGERFSIWAVLPRNTATRAASAVGQDNKPKTTTLPATVFGVISHFRVPGPSAMTFSFSSALSNATQSVSPGEPFNLRIDFDTDHIHVDAKSVWLSAEGGQQKQIEFFASSCAFSSASSTLRSSKAVIECLMEIPLLANESTRAGIFSTGTCFDVMLNFGENKTTVINLSSMFRNRRVCLRGVVPNAEHVNDIPFSLASLKAARVAVVGSTRINSDEDLAAATSTASLSSWPCQRVSSAAVSIVPVLSRSFCSSLSNEAAAVDVAADVEEEEPLDEHDHLLQVLCAHLSPRCADSNERDGGCSGEFSMISSSDLHRLVAADFVRRAPFSFNGETRQCETEFRPASHVDWLAVHPAVAASDLRSSLTTSNQGGRRQQKQRSKLEITGWSLVHTATHNATHTLAQPVMRKAFRLLGPKTGQIHFVVDEQQLRHVKNNNNNKQGQQDSSSSSSSSLFAKAQRAAEWAKESIYFEAGSAAATTGTTTAATRNLHSVTQFVPSHLQRRLKVCGLALNSSLDVIKVVPEFVASSRSIEAMRVDPFFANNPLVVTLFATSSAKNSNHDDNNNDKNDNNDQTKDGDKERCAVFPLPPLHVEGNVELLYCFRCASGGRELFATVKNAASSIAGKSLLLEEAAVWDPLESTCRHASLSIL